MLPLMSTSAALMSPGMTGGTPNGPKGPRELRVDNHDYLSNDKVRSQSPALLAELQIGEIVAGELMPEMVGKHLAVLPSTMSQQIA